MVEPKQNSKNIGLLVLSILLIIIGAGGIGFLIIWPIVTLLVYGDPFFIDFFDFWVELFIIIPGLVLVLGIIGLQKYLGKYEKIEKLQLPKEITEKETYQVEKCPRCGGNLDRLGYCPKCQGYPVQK